MSDNFANTFEETIKSETARELIVQGADITFSKIAESGLLNEIPIFGLIVFRSVEQPKIIRNIQV